ncbi:MAG: DUF6082 family protein [Opitutaceae bacterium]
MTGWHWFTENWFTGLQTLAIFASFAFTAISLRRDDHSRRVANLFKLTAGHRELWALTLREPALRRVLSANVNLALEPVTEDETLFVTFLLLHLNTAHHAIRDGLIDQPEGLGADIRTFFANPIPRFVWRKLRPLQDAAFIVFVETHFDRI